MTIHEKCIGAISAVLPLPFNFDASYFPILLGCILAKYLPKQSEFKTFLLSKKNKFKFYIS